MSICSHPILRRRQYLPANTSPPPTMQAAPDPRRFRGHLERCWCQECDIDPLILRLRLLRLSGAAAQARCLEQELLPLF
jgi:hypothetical protein